MFFKKMEVFSKKDAQIFAGSKKVATFASAFEKYRFLQISRGFTIKELKALCKRDFPKRKVLEKVFGGSQKITYLCSPFRRCLARDCGKNL